MKPLDIRIVARHISPGRENQVQEFPLNHFRRLTIGRDPSSEIRYDADLDDLVSRQHARIEVKETDPLEVEITDLNSRNGTFVNKRRIHSPTRLSPGDKIQFGASGPELQFNIDPPPSGTARTTRFADPGETVPPTREATGSRDIFPSTGNNGIGRNTVETMLAQVHKRTGVWIGAAALAVVLIIAGTMLAIPGTRKLLFGQPLSQPESAMKSTPLNTALTAKEIAAGSTDSVVFIEVGWKLIDTESGHQVSQICIPNISKNKKGQTLTLVPQAGNVYIPIFVVVNNQVEPMLTTNSAPHLRAIGGQHSGTGFVVSSDGFILTNRHVAATWNTGYHWPTDDHYGLLIVLTTDPASNKFVLQKKVPMTSAQFPKDWVPQHAKFLLDGSFDPESERDLSNRITGKTLDGRNDYLDITFAKNRLRVPGRLTRVSDEADVAMVKLDLPQSVHKVELNDNYSSIRPGDPITVMGYPSVSPPVYGIVASRDPFNSGQSAHIIPDPTISIGNIARVIRGQSTPSVSEAIESSMGDAYQLTVNSTGAGNSGGPVFDEHGHAVGIFTSSIRSDAMITFAVPVRYGMDLMGINKIAQ
jgi:serine protease Do